MKPVIENAEKRFKELLGMSSIGAEITANTLIFVDRLVISKLGMMACAQHNWYQIVENGIAVKPAYAMTMTFSSGTDKYLEIDMAVVHPGENTYLVHVNFRYEFEMDYITATIYG